MRKIYTLLVVFAIVSVSRGFCDYSQFYYLDRAVMEQRLVHYFSNGSDLLYNYPNSLDPNEITKESAIINHYGFNLTKEVALKDINKAIKNKDYYGLIMVASSVLDNKDGNQIKEVILNHLKDLIGNDKYQNAVVAYAAKSLISYRFLVDGEALNKTRMTAISDFVRSLRISGFDSKEYRYLESIDQDIFETVFIELAN